MGDSPTSHASLYHNTDNIYYSFTLKRIRQGVGYSELEYNLSLDKMLKKYKAEYCTHTFERDSIGRLHMHGVFLANKKLRYTSYREKYLHIFINKIHSYEELQNWVDYIHKEDHEQIRSYFQNGENHFIEEASPLETKRADEQK